VKEQGKHELNHVYYIGGSGDNFWYTTNATILRGAKRLAMIRYQQSVGSVIMVGMGIQEDEFGNRDIECVIVAEHIEINP
jgi:hypothetical protein